MYLPWAQMLIYFYHLNPKCIMRIQMASDDGQSFPPWCDSFGQV